MATRSTAEAAAPQARWAELLREGRAGYAALVLVGVLLHALQILVVTIIMPTVVADIGGAAYYTWASMIYTVGSIVGAAGVGPVWNALGRRRGYVLGAVVFLGGTAGCALAPDMASLIAARGVQGLAGGLIVGGSMALIGTLFEERLRTRMMAVYQGVWMLAQLLGPAVGGLFAEFGWWRGSFWSMVPIAVLFALLAWFRLPASSEDMPGRGAWGSFPLLRLGLLAAGVSSFAAIGPAEGALPRLVLAAAAVGLLWAAWRLENRATNRLYPATAFSLRSPVGIALAIMFLVGATQTSISVFLPLLLQVVHGISPLLISVVTTVISAGWTIGTFAVSGWTGERERRALAFGPVLIIAGLAGMVATATLPALPVLIGCAFVLGLGMGTHNVHLVARTLAAAAKGEERLTASSVPSVRSIGTASGAAMAGVLSTMAGLGDATQPEAVGGAVTVVYAANLLPAVAIAVLMIRLLRLKRPGAALGGGGPSQ